MSKRILVVDDDADMRLTLKLALEIAGYAVAEAGNAHEALACQRTQPADVLITDIFMPDADGFEILARMRTHEGLRNVPIIMTTAKATRDAVLNGLKRGADGYVTKPYDMQALMTAIKTVLGLK